MTGEIYPGESNKPAGSSQPGEPVFLVVGKLRRPHGLRGELLMEVITDFPERLQPGVTVYVGEHHNAEVIRSLRRQGEMMLVAFMSRHTAEQAGEWRNTLVYVRTDDRPALPEGEFYHHQLLGMRVMKEEGSFLGYLNKILDTGANDIFVIRTESGQEILLPAIDEVILEINVEQREMRVHILPGLLAE